MRGLVQVREVAMPASDNELLAMKQQKTHLARLCSPPIPPTMPTPARGPALYPQNLTPAPSQLHPHCMAKDQLQSWIPALSAQVTPSMPALDEAGRDHVKDTMMHAWEEETRISYGLGLLMWHVFCNDKGVPETQRALAKQPLLSAFVAHLATAYSGKTIANYLNGVWAWHLLHSLPWALQKQEMDLMLHTTDKLMPTTSKRKKHCPYTPKFISAIQQQLDLDHPLNVAVFACLTTCFYASARLGEFVVRTLSSFNPNTHITTQHLSHDQDQNGFQIAMLHLPTTKAAGADGEDVYWASQEGNTDPMAALECHLKINQPSEGSHLFTYKATHTHHPLTKSKFLERVRKAAPAAGHELLQGHSIQIGSTFEYLLWGVPFDVMKVQGRWAGDSFWLYLRKHVKAQWAFCQSMSWQGILWSLMEVKP